MEQNVSLLAALGAGILSFISPCVLPLVPGYLSFISGVSIDDMMAADSGAKAEGGNARLRVFLASLSFVLGFSLVFITLGASATALGKVVFSRLTLLGQIAGIVLIVFGLHTMGVFKIRWLYQEKRVQTEKKPAGALGALLVGIAFAFGWTPCIGPILAAILAVAGSQDTVWRGIQLLAVYSAGLGIPFLLASLAVTQFFSAFAKIRRYYKMIEVTAGLLMVVIGGLIFTNKFTVIAQWLTPYLPVY